MCIVETASFASAADSSKAMVGVGNTILGTEAAVKTGRIAVLDVAYRLGGFASAAGTCSPSRTGRPLRGIGASREFLTLRSNPGLRCDDRPNWR